MIEEVQLDATAIDYVKRHLQSGHALSQSILRQGLVFSRAYTLLPIQRPAANVAEFDAGGKIETESVRDTPVRIPTMDDALVGRIERYLGKDASRLCIIENALAEATDPFLTKLDTFFTYGREVYHPAWTGASAEQILSTLLVAKSALDCVGILTTGPGANYRRGVRAVSLDELSGWARATHTVFVGAYDGESYVFAEVAR